MNGKEIKVLMVEPGEHSMTGETGDGAVLLWEMVFGAARSMRGRFLG